MIIPKPHNETAVKVMICVSRAEICTSTTKPILSHVKLVPAKTDICGQEVVVYVGSAAARELLLRTATTFLT
jgi:hypothetical protein